MRMRSLTRPTARRASCFKCRRSLSSSGPSPLIGRAPFHVLLVGYVLGLHLPRTFVTLPSTDPKHKPVAFTSTDTREQARPAEDATAQQQRAASKGDRGTHDHIALPGQLGAL